MQEEVEYSELTPAAGAHETAADLARLRDVPVDLVVEVGRTRMTIGEALKLAPGSVIGLNRLAGDPVSLLVNGKPIARGEVVVVDEEFGLRVTEVLSAAGTAHGAYGAQGAVAEVPEPAAAAEPPAPLDVEAA